MTAVIAKDLSKRFGARGVLRHLTLTIAPGSIYGLLGRNGAGKTTLLKTLMGLVLADSGEARVMGASLVTGTAADKGRVGYVAEQGLLPGWMKLSELVRFEASVRPRFEATRIRDYLRRERLEEGRRASALSKGQRKRLELELALAAVPPVLILDEPFDGLDPVSRADAMEALVSHVATTGGTILVSSHVLSDLERMCDRIGVLSGGRIAFEAELDALKESVFIIYGGRASDAGRLPIATEVIASRSEERGSTWLVRGLQPEDEARLTRDGFQHSRPNLDELGLELIRCLDAAEERL